MTTSTASGTRTTPGLLTWRRFAATGSVVALLLLVGLVSGTLWQSAERRPFFDTFAYGLPSLLEGRWWTPVTGSLLVIHPWLYVPTVLMFVGMAYVEFRRGPVLALGWFVLGQLFAVFASMMFAMLLAPTGWPWAQMLAGDLDVGPSGGAAACLAVAIGLLREPWRIRAWTALLLWSVGAVLYIGAFADVLHFAAVLLVLLTTRSLHLRRISAREQRLIAFAVAIAFGVIELIAILVPTKGPFGTTEPLGGSWLDVGTDIIVIGLIANGLRRGRRWAWIVAQVLAAVNVLGSVFLIVLRGAAPEILMDYEGGVNQSITAGVLWTAFWLFLILTRSSFRTRGAKRLAGTQRISPAEARHIVQTQGGGNLSWMATWDGFEHLRTPGGMVAFQRHRGVAIALGDAVGHPDTVADSAREFIKQVEGHALIPCFFSATKPTRDAVPSDWRALIVAEDTVVDLPDISFQGKPRARVRQAFSRAERDGEQFRMAPWAEHTWGVRQQIRGISEGWVGDKDLPEMRFTLGTLAEAEDPQVRIAVAIAPNGDVDGFVSWLPVYGADGEVHGWTLDLMRRRDGGFPVVMEFLIGSSAKTFSEEGALTLSLSGAPFAHQASPGDGMIANLLEGFAQAIEPVYGFRSLHKFKEKFTPRYEPMYLLYRDEGDLARIAAALTSAFLPDASLPQLARAGLALRGPDEAR